MDQPETTVEQDLDELVDDMVRQLDFARENGGDARDVVHRVLKGALDEIATHDARRMEVESVLSEFLLGVANAAVLWKERVTGTELLTRIRELREREVALIDLVHRLDDGSEAFAEVRLWAYPLSKEQSP